jgi:type II restriction enzyme
LGLITGNDIDVKIPINKFEENAKLLLERLLCSTKGVFEVPEIEDFLRMFNCSSLKAKSNKKNDIRIVIHDLRTSSTKELGFSIKSQLGSASTLLNSSQSTNFIFKIKGNVLSNSQIQEINNLKTRSKIKDRIKAILDLGNKLEFDRCESSIFSNNLTLIDSYLAKIIGEMLLTYFSSNYSTIPDLVKSISQANPLKYDLNFHHPFYEYKIKRFLTDISLGMMPSKVWNGCFETTGGFLVVKTDGEVLCYHIYNRNEFEDYLLNNTKFETSSSSRHKYGEIFLDNGNLYFKLNLQIRFIF